MSLVDFEERYGCVEDEDCPVVECAECGSTEDVERVPCGRRHCLPCRQAEGIDSGDVEDDVEWVAGRIVDRYRSVTP